MSQKGNIVFNGRLIFAFIFLLGLSIFIKTAYVQRVEGEKWMSKRDAIQLQVKPLEADRGEILSRNGRVLATSLTYYTLHMDPLASGITDELFAQHVDELAYQLALHTDANLTPGGWRERLKTARETGKRYLLIKKNVAEDELKIFRQFPLFSLGRNSGGLIVEPTKKRERPFNLLADRTIGRDRENKPVGLEAAFDDVLSGQEGKMVWRKIDAGVWVPDDIALVNPKSGNDIITTIDINKQDIVESALLKRLEYHDAEYGTAILMDVQTGDIVAIANLSKLENGGYWETYNNAIGKSTEPGSTFKLATVLSLLEDEYISLDDSISINYGKAQFFEQEMVDAGRESFSMNRTTVQRAFEISSNVAFANLADYYYRDTRNEGQFLKNLQSFGLRDRTEISLLGEADPFIKEPGADGWSGTTIPWMSIGYEVQLTPLQMLTFYNAIANDGKQMRPRLVQEVRKYDSVKKYFKPQIINKRIASKRAVSQVQSLLEGVMIRGTGRDLQPTYFRAAGKTGTTQLNYRNGKSNLKYQASFAGYFPVKNPKYSCIVVINDPKANGYYGSTVAGPVFKEIAERIYSIDKQLHVSESFIPDRLRSLSSELGYQVGQSEELEQIAEHLDLPIDYRTQSEYAILMKDGQENLSLMKRSVVHGVIPDVRNMGVRDAVFALENLGMQVEVRGEIGKVKRQTMKPGSKIMRGGKITIFLE